MERNNIRSWVQRNMKKFNAVTGKKNEVSTERDLKSIANSFIDYLKAISNELSEIEKIQEVAEEKFSENTKIKNSNKIMRISNDKKE